MTPLLEYLVERSIRGRPEAAAAAPRAGDIARTEAQEQPASPDLRRGAIRPRVRSRHEDWPDFAATDRDTRMAAEEIQQWLRPRGAEKPQAEEREEAPAADREVESGSAPLTKTPKDTSRTVAATSRWAIVGRRDAQQPGPERQDPVDGAGLFDPAPSQPDRNPGAAALSMPPVVREERQAPPPSVPSENPKRAQAAPQPREAESAPLAHAQDPPRSGQVSPTLRPRRREIESPASPGEKIARAEEPRAPRGPSGASPIVSPPPALERSNATRIEVNIGRVEVRAVYAPPQQARKPPSLPSISLDDYLKQRDRTG
jgi:hypothetical protein